jgi:hypothetical protein
MPPCCQCKSEPLCTKAGICLEYRRLVDAVDERTPATARPVHGGYPDGGVPDPYSGPAEPYGVTTAPASLQGLADYLRSQAQQSLNNCDRSGVGARTQKSVDCLRAWADAVAGVSGTDGSSFPDHTLTPPK